GDMFAIQLSETQFHAGVSSSTLVSATFTGLDPESTYCWRLAATTDISGEQATAFWPQETNGNLPTLTQATYTHGSTSIGYSATINAQSENWPAAVKLEYFSKGSESCDAYTGSVVTTYDYNPDGGWNGWGGTSDQPISGELDGLAPGTTYCIRSSAESRWGLSETQPWSEVTTVSPTAITVDAASLHASSIAGPNRARLDWTIDDHGASEDTGDQSQYEVLVFDVGANRCTNSDYFGGDLVSSLENVPLSGVDENGIELTNLTVGKPYCVTIFGDSAWGNDYDVTYHHEFYYGDAPTVSAQSVNSTTASSITFDTTVNPGGLTTSYGLQYFKKGASACGDDTEATPLDGPTGTIASYLTLDHGTTPSIGGLDAQTTYCVRGVASNSWGVSTYGTWDEATTRKQPVASTITDTGSYESVAATNYNVQYRLDDQGAADDTDGSSAFSARNYPLPADQCDAAHTSAATAVNSTSEAFGGRHLYTWLLSGLNAGTSYCVHVAIESAWGASYDSEAWISFTTPRAPSFGAVTTSGTSNSLTFNSSLDANWTNTYYTFQWKVKSSSATCTNADDSEDLGSTNSATSSSPKSLTYTVTGLSVGKTVCGRFGAANGYGTNYTDWTEATVADTQPPSKPTGLTGRLLGDQGATYVNLNWDAAADDVGVAHYVVTSGDVQIYSGGETSANANLACGQTASYAVSAVDAAGNVSPASDPVSVYGGPCAPSTYSCFAAFKTLKITGKVGDKKYTLVVSGKLSNDARTIGFTYKLSGAGKKKAKAGFARKKNGALKKTASLTDASPLFVGYLNKKKLTYKKLTLRTSTCTA
ncbi:MAG: hypothetical protein QM648_06715, partial [Solirubrobacterales bacterium]